MEQLQAISKNKANAFGVKYHKLWSSYKTRGTGNASQGGVEYHKLQSSYKKPVSVRNHTYRCKEAHVLQPWVSDTYNIKYKKLNVVTRHKQQVEKIISKL